MPQEHPYELRHARHHRHLPHSLCAINARSLRATHLFDLLVGCKFALTHAALARSPRFAWLAIVRSLVAINITVGRTCDVNETLVCPISRHMPMYHSLAARTRHERRMNFATIFRTMLTLPAPIYQLTAMRSHFFRKSRDYLRGLFLGLTISTFLLIDHYSLNPKATLKE